MSARPRMSAPELLSQVGKLLQQHPRADTFQPRHDLTDLLIRPLRHQQVNVVAGDLTGHDLQLMFCGNLPQQVAHTNCHFPRQHRLAVFCYPHEMDLEVTLRVRAQPVMSHATTLHHSLLRLKARGSTIPDGDTKLLSISR